MKPETIIVEYGLREAQEASMVRPEGIPAALLQTFRDHHEVKAYTNEDHSAWLLVSLAERRFLFQAPLVN